MFRPFTLHTLSATGLALALITSPDVAPARQAETAQSLAEVSALRDEIGKAASATAVLDRWCVSHHMAPEGAVIAEKIANKPVSATAAAGISFLLHASGMSLPACPLPWRQVFSRPARRSAR